VESKAIGIAERIMQGQSVTPEQIGGAEPGIYGSDGNLGTASGTIPPLTLSWAQLIGDASFHRGILALAIPFLGLVSSGVEQQSRLPSRFSLMQQGQLSLGIRLGFYENEEEEEDDYISPAQRAQQQIDTLQVISATMHSGHVPSFWENIDVGSLASILWSIFSTYISPQVGSAITQFLSRSTSEGISFELDLILDVGFDFRGLPLQGGGLIFTIRF